MKSESLLLRVAYWLENSRPMLVCLYARPAFARTPCWQHGSACMPPVLNSTIPERLLVSRLMRQGSWPSAPLHTSLSLTVRQPSGAFDFGGLVSGQHGPRAGSIPVPVWRNRLAAGARTRSNFQKPRQSSQFCAFSRRGSGALCGRLTNRLCVMDSLVELFSMATLCDSQALLQSRADSR